MQEKKEKQPGLTGAEKGKKIIAVPVEGDKLCPHFGHSEKFALIETEDDMIISEKLLDPPVHAPGVFPAWLAEMGAGYIITGGIGNRAVGHFDRSGIKVFRGAEVKTPRELAEDLINGQLKTSPDSCDHHHHNHHHQQHHQHHHHNHHHDGQHDHHDH